MDLKSNYISVICVYMVSSWKNLMLLYQKCRLKNGSVALLTSSLGHFLFLLLLLLIHDYGPKAFTPSFSPQRMSRQIPAEVSWHLLRCCGSCSQHAADVAFHAVAPATRASHLCQPVGGTESLPQPQNPPVAYSCKVVLTEKVVGLAAKRPSVTLFWISPGCLKA